MGGERWDLHDDISAAQARIAIAYWRLGIHICMVAIIENKSIRICMRKKQLLQHGR